MSKSSKTEYPMTSPLEDLQGERHHCLLSSLTGRLKKTFFPPLIDTNNGMVVSRGVLGVGGK